MTVRILIGDVREQLRTLPDESVHCVVTSPPYWGLRDYGVAGQLGLEPTLGEHIAVMVDVFREVRRVLRKDGTLWLNYGDCYATSVNGRSAADTKAAGNDDRTFRDKPFSTVGPIYAPHAGQKSRTGRSDNLRNQAADRAGRIGAGGYLKPKDLCGVPWRIAFALQDDGWWLRQDIIWSKPNPMPESIKDRCTKSHEYLFLLTKSARYYFDGEAIKEPSIYADSGRKSAAKHDLSPGRKRNGNGTAASFRAITKTRNRRSVWTVATKGFKEAHFATFPPALIEPCIKAGCPPLGTVMDPFGGSGTAGMVASRLQRDCILIDLQYETMARRRINNDATLFAEAAE